MTTINQLRRLLPLAVLGLGFFAVLASESHAQYYKPTLSPYLDYFRQDSPILPNYHQFVRPKIQLQDTLNRQNMMLQNQQRQLQVLGQGLSGMVSGEVAPTGIQAGYMNFSHYYQPAQTRRPVR